MRVNDLTEVFGLFGPKQTADQQKKAATIKAIQNRWAAIANKPTDPAAYYKSMKQMLHQSFGKFLEPGELATLQTPAAISPQADAQVFNAAADMFYNAKQGVRPDTAPQQQPTPTPANPPPEPAPTPAQIPAGQLRTVDGQQYQWLGAQWAKYNPATGRASQTAKREVVPKLNAAPVDGTASIPDPVNPNQNQPANPPPAAGANPPANPPTPTPTAGGPAPNPESPPPAGGPTPAPPAAGANPPANPPTPTPTAGGDMQQMLSTMSTRDKQRLLTQLTSELGTPIRGA